MTEADVYFGKLNRYCFGIGQGNSCRLTRKYMYVELYYDLYRNCISIAYFKQVSVVCHNKICLPEETQVEQTTQNTDNIVLGIGITSL